VSDEPASRPRALALRALAHPLRWKLIDLVGSEGSATATRCAEVLGESVASCSYHLGILAKYGYIELVPGQPGKEKPWRLTSPDQDIGPDGLDPEEVMAAEAASEAFLEHEMARMKERMRRLGLEPAPWQQASRMEGATTWMTAEELQDVRDQLTLLLTRYRERASDPSLRPPGSREVRLFGATSVAPPIPPPARAAPAADQQPADD
jgi:Helix-turn-helix domain